MLPGYFNRYSVHCHVTPCFLFEGLAWQELNAFKLVDVLNVKASIGMGTQGISFTGLLVVGASQAGW